MGESLIPCHDRGVSTFQYKLVRKTHVAVHTVENPSDAEWQAYLDHIKEWIRFVDGIFSYTVGGGPNAAQRDRSVEFWKGQAKQPPIAVVTPSILVVRMAGALRWFMPTQIKAFVPRDMNKAYDYLQLGVGERGAVEQAVQSLAEAQGLKLGREADLGRG
jgi:hypothetical protein